MIRFSANLGFLWAELPLPDAIRAAARAGFDAVECHWPYATPPEETRAALEDTGLPMVGINTIRGAAGEMGLAALPGREGEARETIDQALAYAAAIGSANVHVMAGRAEGPEAHATFLGNLRHAARRAAPLGVGVLIEPLNPRDAPGYFLRSTGQAAEILRELDEPCARLMFDCYHAQVAEGDVTKRLEALLPLVGHVQIAGAPGRGRPDRGELNLSHVLAALDAAGYAGFVGAEYRPDGPEEAELGWMGALRG
jgi:2-dehydrotetronate isomerase